MVTGGRSVESISAQNLFQNGSHCSKVPSNLVIDNLGSFACEPFDSPCFPFLNSSDFFSYSSFISNFSFSNSSCFSLSIDRNSSSFSLSANCLASFRHFLRYSISASTPSIFSSISLLQVHTSSMERPFSSFFSSIFTLTSSTSLAKVANASTCLSRVAVFFFSTMSLPLLFLNSRS